MSDSVLPRGSYAFKVRFFLLAFTLAFDSGCTEDGDQKPYGKHEDLGKACVHKSSKTTAPSVKVSRDSKTCETSVCLSIDPGASTYCTHSCSSDGECEVLGDTACQGGFVCADLPTDVDTCCRGVCVCSDNIDFDALHQTCLVRETTCQISDPDDDPPLGTG